MSCLLRSLCSRLGSLSHLKRWMLVWILDNRSKDFCKFFAIIKWLMFFDPSTMDCSHHWFHNRSFDIVRKRFRLRLFHFSYRFGICVEQFEDGGISEKQCFRELFLGRTAREHVQEAAEALHGVRDAQAAPAGAPRPVLAVPGRGQGPARGRVEVGQQEGARRCPGDCGVRVRRIQTKGHDRVVGQHGQRQRCRGQSGVVQEVQSHETWGPLHFGYNTFFLSTLIGSSFDYG